jgi:hypothetical protein
VLWAGHSVASFGLPLQLAPRQSRRLTLAAFSTVAGGSFALASIAGGILASRLPEHLSIAGVPAFGIQVLFLVSGAGQMAALFLAGRVPSSTS